MSEKKRKVLTGAQKAKVALEAIKGSALVGFDPFPGLLQVFSRQHCMEQC